MNPVAAIVEDKVRQDPWLAALIGRPVFQLQASWEMLAGDPGASAAATRRWKDGFPRSAFVWAKVPATQIGAVHALEEAGFRLADTNILLQRQPSPGIGSQISPIRGAQPEDRSEVAAVARNSFRFDRFHLDPGFTTAVADSIKEAWATNFFNGKRGDEMYVAEADGRVAGFLQLLRRPDGDVVIDLIAVQQDCRGRGLARSMIAAVGTHHAASSIHVGTQAANLPSLRLYEGMNFRITGTTYVFHRHVD